MSNLYIHIEHNTFPVASVEDASAKWLQFLRACEDHDDDPICLENPVVTNDRGDKIAFIGWDGHVWYLH